MSDPQDAPQSRPPMPNVAFDADVRRHGDLVIVLVSGELCLYTTPMLSERLDSLDQGLARLIVDLRRVSFLDSTGIRLLASLENRAQVQGFDFAIALGEGEALRTLKLVGFAERLSRVEGEEVDRVLGEGSGE